MKIAEAYVELRIDRKKAERDAREAGASAGKVAGDAMRGALDMFKAAAFTAGLKKSIDAASDLNETVSKTGVIFGNSADEMDAWATKADKAMGMSKRSALDAASTFAVFGKSAGLVGDQLVGFSQDLTGLAADLASFNNTSPEQAIEAIGAALRGESEPIRQYGVLLDDATLKQRAMTLGIYDGNGSLTQQQRVLAAQAEIMAQTGLAQGDFARTADGVANSQRIAAASAENAAASFGQVLLPVYDRALEVVTWLVDKFAALPKPLQTAVVAMAGLAALSGPIGAVKDVVTDLAQAMIKAGVSATTMVGALGAVGGVLALAGGLYYAYTQDKRRAEKATDDFVAALKAEASGQRDATKALIARNIVDSEYLGNAEKLGLSQQDLADVITGKNVPAFDKLRTSLEDVLDSTVGNEQKTRLLKETYGVSEGQARGFLVEIDRLSAAYSAAVVETDKLASTEAALGIETDKATSATEDLTSATGDLTGATDEVTGSLWDQVDVQKAAKTIADEVADAVDRQRQAIKDLYDELLGQVDAQRAYEAALDSAEGAAADLVATMKDSKSTLEDIDDASRNAADASIEAAKAYAKAQGASLDSKAGIDAMVQSLYVQASTLDVNSPLRQRLLDYITELQKIPSTVDTTIRLSVTGQTVTKSGEIIGLGGYNPFDPSNGKHRAAGGPVTAGETYLVGENGPELFTASTSGRIESNASLKKGVFGSEEFDSIIANMYAVGDYSLSDYRNYLEQRKNEFAKYTDEWTRMQQTILRLNEEEKRQNDEKAKTLEEIGARAASGGYVEPIYSPTGTTAAGAAARAASSTYQENHYEFTVNAYGDRNFLMWVREGMRQLEREGR